MPASLSDSGRFSFCLKSGKKDNKKGVGRHRANFLLSLCLPTPVLLCCCAASLLRLCRGRANGILVFRLRRLLSARTGCFLIVSSFWPCWYAVPNSSRAENIPIPGRDVPRLLTSGRYIRRLVSHPFVAHHCSSLHSSTGHDRLSILSIIDYLYIEY